MKISVLILVSFLPFVTTDDVFLQNFVTKKDTDVAPNVQPIGIQYCKSVISCASDCSKTKDCCSASYDKEKNICALFNCCFPETVTAVGKRHIRKIPSAVELSTTVESNCYKLPMGSDNDVYRISLADNRQINVYCDMRRECRGGWTVIQRRIDGTTNFNVTWAAYKAGFGDVHKEYWIGNDNLNVLTTSNNYTLRFDIEDFDGIAAYAEYSTFIVGDESTKYRLTIADYSGTAGDSMIGVYSLNGQKFTTLDQDNDGPPDNCAADSRMGGWWFNHCARVNANGIYKATNISGVDSIYWREFRDFDALKSISMKIKPH